MVVLNLWNGIATLNVSLPTNVEIGDVLCFECWVKHDSLIEPFFNDFTRHVIGPITNHSGQPGKRQPPAGNGSGERQIPDMLGLPEVLEVREEDWDKHGFDKYSALKVFVNGKGSYDFFVNLDNLYLRFEIKSNKKSDPQVLESQFKFSLVLIGLALLRAKLGNKDKSHSGWFGDQDGENIEEVISHVTQLIAPTLLPMINTLGDLEIEETVEEEKLFGQKNNEKSWNISNDGIRTEVVSQPRSQLKLF